MRITTLLLAVVLSASFAGPSIAQEVERVEPPFWWTGFEHRELQLMLHGNNISLLTPAIDHAGIEINRVVRVDSPNYLFIYLEIGPDTEPGTFDIQLSEGDYSIQQSYELRARNTDPDHTRGFTAADAMLLITPDRFANGDPSNDEFDFLADKAESRRSLWPAWRRPAGALG